MEKREKYELLCKQVESLAAGETNVVGVLANVSAAMKTMFPEEYFWVGFYLVSPKMGLDEGVSDAVQSSNAVSQRSIIGNEPATREKGSLQGGAGGRLLLGPFQGTVACYEIPYGKGVCGSAWKERKTLVVPDVEEFPGHIACSSLSRSEIVVPIFVQTDGDDEKEVWGVIDIDSTELNTFDEVDAVYLEKIAEILSKNIW